LYPEQFCPELSTRAQAQGLAAGGLRPKGGSPKSCCRELQIFFLFEQGLCQKGRKFNNLFKLHGYLNRRNRQGIYFVEIILEKMDTKYALKVSIWVESIQA
jgi:hypothetical protein